MIGKTQCNHSSQKKNRAARFLLGGWSLGVLAPLLMALLVAAPQALFSQLVPTVTAKIQPEEIRLGGTAIFTLTVENGQPHAPLLKLPEGVETLSETPTYSSETDIVRGVRTQTTEFRWEISCSKNGRHVIPPQEVEIAGKKYSSNETRLIVKNNPSTPSPYDPILTMEIEKREIYLGESVPVTVNLYLHRGVMLRRVGLIEIPKDNFAIQRFPQHPQESMVNMGGERYEAYGFHSTLSALKDGKFKLGPATSEIIIDLPLERGAMRGYFPTMEPRKSKPVSNDIELTVVPLPVEGRPAAFKGIVGDFEMSATADLHDLTVGDPISVEITINGSGNFDTLSPPSLVTAQSWKTYPARRTNIPRADSIPEGGLHSATFSQVLIPRQVAEFIPPFEFSYFSPTKKKYLTARTLPIPLHMQPGGATSKPSGAAPGATVETAPAEPEKVPPPQPKVTDILTVLPAQAAWITPRPALFRDHKFFVWNMAALGFLSLLVLGKLAALMWRAHALSSSTPLRVIHRELRRASVPRGRFYQMAAHYIELRHDSTQPLPEPLREVLARNDQINYSPETEKAGAPIPPDERARVLAALTP